MRSYSMCRSTTYQMLTQIPRPSYTCIEPRYRGNRLLLLPRYPANYQTGPTVIPRLRTWVRPRLHKTQPLPSAPKISQISAPI
eukprot:184784-Rhodomonas_salina.1